MALSPSNFFDSLFNRNSVFFKRVTVVWFVIALICVMSIIHFFVNHPKIEAQPTSPTITLPGQFSVLFQHKGNQLLARKISG